MFNNLVINSEVLKYCVKLGGYCGPQEVHIVQMMNGEKGLKEQKKRYYLPFFSSVCFSSDMSTPFSCKEAIETQDTSGVFCLSTAKDKRRSV